MIAECWLWEGFVRLGYGRTSYNGVPLSVHRAAYEAIRGPIPEGLVIDHMCNVKQCYNPFHMECVTQGENARRTPRGTVTHCSHGHEYTQENSYWNNGRRYCRTCRRKGENVMAEGEVQQAINLITEAVDKLADVGGIVTELQAAVRRLKDAVNGPSVEGSQGAESPQVQTEAEAQGASQEDVDEGVMDPEEAVADHVEGDDNRASTGDDEPA